MNITNTVLTKTAEETTANATYIIEYVLINEVLTRIHATVQAFLPDGIEKLDVGYITYENGNIFCNLTEQGKPSLYFLDFEKFVEKIKESAGEMQQPENISDR
ncbi:hypothetical protein [Parabacteroides distasonis]|uniref:hypothetical protein n=1 Tax=Parabacteroides distasonis TaxID=823 RepID=UPI003219F012